MTKIRSQFFWKPFCGNCRCGLWSFFADFIQKVSNLFWCFFARKQTQTVMCSSFTPLSDAECAGPLKFNEMVRLFCDLSFLKIYSRMWLRRCLHRAKNASTVLWKTLATTRRLSRNSMSMSNSLSACLSATRKSLGTWRPKPLTFFWPATRLQPSSSCRSSSRKRP